MFATTDSKRKVYWLGNPEFETLVKLQGLCKPCKINLTKSDLEHYPTPIFFDKNENAYFNVLNNYLIKTSYWGLHPETVNDPVLKQIFANVMVPWNGYFPKMRNLGSEFFEELIRTGRIRDRSRIITLILNDKIEDILKWNLHNIKEFAQLIANKGIRVVVFSKHSNLFHGTKIIAFDFNIRNILQLINRSWMVLSNDINLLLISMMSSDCKIMGPSIDGPMNLLKNAEFLEVQNDIFSSRNWISPIEAYTICEGLL